MPESNFNSSDRRLRVLPGAYDASQEFDANENSGPSAQPFRGRFVRALALVIVAVMAHVWVVRAPRSDNPATTAEFDGVLPRDVSSGAAAGSATAHTLGSVTVETRLVPVATTGTVPAEPGGSRPNVKSAEPSPPADAARADVALRAAAEKPDGSAAEPENGIGVTPAEHRTDTTAADDAQPADASLVRAPLAAAPRPADDVRAVLAASSTAAGANPPDHVLASGPARVTASAPERATASMPERTIASRLERPLASAPERVAEAAPERVMASARERTIKTDPIVEPDQEALVRRVLRQYVAAYEGLDAGAAKIVYPAVNESALRRAFGQLETQRLTFESCGITISGTGANARCLGEAAYRPRIGARALHRAPREWTFDLTKADDGWHIVKATTTIR